MASGDSIWVLHPEQQVGPATLFATKDWVLDASTPAALTPVMDFDGAADEHADFLAVVPSQYAGGGFTISYRYAMDGTVGTAVEIEFRMLDLTDASSVLTADLGLDTQTPVLITDDPSATANEYNISTTGALSHVNAGSPAIGAVMLIRATRDISFAVNGDDLQLIAIDIKET